MSEQTQTITLDLTKTQHQELRGAIEMREVALLERKFSGELPAEIVYEFLDLLRDIRRQLG